MPSRFAHLYQDLPDSDGQFPALLPWIACLLS